MSGREKPCLVLSQNNLGSSCPFTLSHLKFNIDLSSFMKKPLLDLVTACGRINILTRPILFLSIVCMNKVRACMLHRFSRVRLFATPRTPGSSVHGILQARILEWVAISSSRGSSQPRDQTKSPGSPALADGFLPLVPPHFSSVTRSCPTLCKPVDCSAPGFPVHHQLPEPTQTHVHRISDAIQPSHLLSSPSPAFSLSQHQGLFQ